MVTGIPNEDIELDDVTISDTSQKVDAILRGIDVVLHQDQYSIKTFEVYGDKPTHAVKLTLKDVEIKSQIINEAKRLKGSAHFNI